MPLLTIYLTLIFIYALISARLERTIITAPILFTLAGIAAVVLVPELTARELDAKLFLHVAEIGLVLLLFTDASKTNLAVLRSIRELPTRLLSAGMLLTIALGALLAWVIFPQISIWEAGIIAAILAPTDAGLGQVIVNDARVPVKVRQGLNVEAGLNDGLSVPFLLFFISLETSVSGASLMQFIGEQLVLGALIGGVIGLLGGWLIGVAVRRNWISPSWQQLGVVALPLLCLLVSREYDASMFIAAFVAGLTVQVGYKSVGKHSVEFSEEWGQLLNLAVFMLFGLIVAREFNQISLDHLLYAVLSLTVIRMVPVAISLLGSGFSKPTILFIGWFGPRGLASIVLGLVYLHEIDAGVEQVVPIVVVATVLLSVFAHGLSALPLIKCYSAHVNKLAQNAPERDGGR